MSPEASKVSQWSPLKCKNGPEGVRLYYDFSNSATGMFVAVTDLRSIWDVSINRDGVVDNAREQSCSIDPAESATQLRTLLYKLKQSLAEGSNDIGYSENQDEREHHEHLTLRTRLKLPPPLKLMQWTFYLASRDEKAVAASITLPLVHEATVLKHQMEKLYQVIKDKDHVLSKLLDKIDNSAIDLSLIFPGISGLKARKHRTDVAEASKHVPGMAIFDRNSWEAGIARNHSGDSIDLSHILDCSRANTTPAILPVDWFRQLPSLDDDARFPDRSRSETDDDVQANTLQSNRPLSANSKDIDSSTESDFEDLASTSRRPRIQKQQSDDSASSPSADKAQAKRPRSYSLIPVTELRGLPRKRRTSESSSSSDSENSARRGVKVSQKNASKLGMLGGKKKASRPRSSPAASISNVSTPTRKLGVLGGRRVPTKSSSISFVPFRARSETPNASAYGGDSDTASNTSSTPASRKRPTNSPPKVATPPPVKEEPPEPEGSVEEKAKRKREELKRLQAGASAGLPKKKVRRF